MFAVFETGGKQHRVTEGEVIRVEKLDSLVGETVEFDKVMMVSAGNDVAIGQPFVEGGRVTAEIVLHGRGEKVRIVKFRRRKNHIKWQGHRQWFTDLRITSISQ